MIQVKIFTNSYPKKLEQAVNEWLKDNDDEVDEIDIHFRTVFSTAYSRVEYVAFVEYDT